MSESGEKRPFIVDTDCGIDDAVALMMVIAAPDAELVGVTTVAGNVGVDQVTENVNRLLAYFDRPEVPVYAGAHRSLLYTEVRASSIHGENGLGNIELPRREKPAPGSAESPELNATVGLRRLLKAHPGATVVALGPLTNLALAFNLYPELIEKIGRLVVMGGAIAEGNVTRFAEFNFYADPEAVQCVLNRGVEIELLPWDTCLLHSFTPKDIDDFGVTAGRAKDLFDRLEGHIFEQARKMFGTPLVMHADPFAMACALDPSVVSRRLVTGLTMELNNTTLRGASVRSEGTNVTAYMDLDMERYGEILRRIGEL